MLPISCASLLVYLFSFAQPVSTTAVQPAVQVRTLPGQSIQDTYNVVKRGLAMASLEKRGNYTAEIPLAKSWKDSTIIYIEMAAASGNVDIHAGIKVQCKHCYMLGNVKAELTIDDNFNATAALESTINEVKQEFLNFTDTVGDYLENYAETVVANLEDGPDWSDFELPTFPYAFDLDIPSLPETNIRFQFDQMELYMELETTMNAGATYELPLYSSKSPLGIEIGELQLGFVLTLDLILAVDGEIAVQNGFHIKLDDGVALNIALFGDKVSDMTFNGGQFEFLPVTIESAGITLSAALRVGVSCGIGVGTTDKSVFNLDTGMEVAVFANIAEFAAIVKHEPENKDCALQVIQEYKFAIGAVAGASIEIDAPVIGTKTLAAVAGVSTAIYTTTLDEVCAIKMTTSAVDASITTPAVKRDDLTTTTLSTEFERSAIYCKVTGIANCPVSEQVTTRTSVTQYLTTAVASDWSSSEFPQNTFESVASVVTFGKAANRILAMSGSPTMYTAAPTNAIDGALSGSVGSVSKKLVVGLSVGLGVPILIAAVAGLLLCQRRRKRASLASTGPAMVAQTYTTESSYGASPDLKKAGVNVNVLQR